MVQVQHFRGFWILFFFIYIVIICDTTADSFAQDKSNWIDPGDMFDNDPIEKAVNSDVENSEMVLQEPSTKLQALEYHDTQLKVAVKKMAKAKLIPSSVNSALQAWSHIFSLIENNDKCMERVFLNRFIYRMILEFKKWGSEELIFKVYVSENELKMLNEVVEKNRTVFSVDDIMMRLFENAQIPEENTVNWNSFSEIINFLISPKIIVIVVLTGCLVLFIWIKATGATMFRIIIAIFCIFIFVNILWDWVHLYQSRIAQQRASLSSLSDAECRPSTTFEYFISYFVITQHKKKCLEYHEAIVIDPVWKVTLLDALSETILKSVFRPLRYLGEEVVYYVYQFADKLPVHITYVFLTLSFLLAFIFAIFVLMFYSGYEFQVSSPLFSFKMHKKINNGQQNMHSSRVEEIKPSNEKEATESTKGPSLIPVEADTKSKKLQTSQNSFSEGDAPPSLDQSLNASNDDIKFKNLPVLPNTEKRDICSSKIMSKAKKIQAEMDSSVKSNLSSSNKVMDSSKGPSQIPIKANMKLEKFQISHNSIDEDGCNAKTALDCAPSSSDQRLSVIFPQESDRVENIQSNDFELKNLPLLLDSDKNIQEEINSSVRSNLSTSNEANDSSLEQDHIENIQNRDC